MAREKSEVELKNAINQYGKQPLTKKQQIRILYSILEDTKNRLEKNSEIYRLIADHQFILEDTTRLEVAIETVNKFIIALEAKADNKIAVNYLKARGFYRIVYRHPRIKGEELPLSDGLHKLLRYGLIGVAASGLITLLFIGTIFFTAPFWLTTILTGMFVGASTYLSGILYGVVNDLFATHSNLPYFLLGHQPQQKSLLRTNNKVAQGIAWGIAATYGPVLVATIVFTVAATITAFFVPLATFLLPIMMVAMPLIAVAAEFYARQRAREYIEQDNGIFWIGSNRYQQDGLDYMCPTKPERAAWCANSDRNMFGFTKVPLIGLGALIGLIVLSAVSMFLPPLLFASPIIAIVIPATFAAVACITLMAASVYMYVNRNEQIDDRYRLEFARTEIEPHLYFDEDMAYVRQLENIYTRQEPDVSSNPSIDRSSVFKAFFDSEPEPALKTVVAQQEELFQESQLNPNSEFSNSLC